MVDVLVQGLIFTGTAASYLEPHGLPSDGGGDSPYRSTHLLSSVTVTKKVNEEVVSKSTPMPQVKHSVTRRAST